MFEADCQICEPQDLIGKKIFLKPNDCKDYKCNIYRVQLSQKINPYCMTSYEVFSASLIANYMRLSYVFATLALLMAIASANRRLGFCGKASKKNKNKSWKDSKDFYDKAFVVFTFQGDNLPDN